MRLPVKAILGVTGAVLIGDYAAGYILPKLGLSNDPNVNFEMYDIAAALVIALTYVLIRRFFE
jgi:hypothetical protein